MSISSIRTFEDLCKYIIFPFMQLFIPKKHDDSSDCTSSNHDVSSQISHNLSNASCPNKTQIELWGRAPGLLKQSIVFSFLGDICNLGIHYIEERNFRVSITSLEKESKGLN